MQYVAFIFAFFCLVACTEDEPLPPSVDCQEGGDIRIRIKNATTTDISEFRLDFHLGNEAPASVFYQLLAGAMTEYCSFSAADGCSYQATLINMGEVVYAYDAQCIIAEPLAPGDYTLTWSCTDQHCEVLTFTED